MGGLHSAKVGQLGLSFLHRYMCVAPHLGTRPHDKDWAKAYLDRKSLGRKELQCHKKGTTCPLCGVQEGGKELGRMWRH